ncbi:hypothetical protein [Micromonospora sp. CP22]|uniref:hypothetical protein n=1 Tax=Micromonospora sp. CP22 TaxID=2580517 RepID=UPI0018AD113A|nr:hypothetical protein [Micromonospora sp. CP22]
MAFNKSAALSVSARGSSLGAVVAGAGVDSVIVDAVIGGPPCTSSADIDVTLWLFLFVRSEVTLARPSNKNLAERTMYLWDAKEEMPHTAR